MREMDDDLLRIVLTIGGQKFELFVKREQEQTYRAAARLINQKYQSYMSEFPNQSKETYLTMTLVDVAVRLQEQVEVDESLEKLALRIDAALGS